MKLASHSHDRNEAVDPQELLRIVGLKATKPRLDLVTALSNEKSPVSIAQLQEKLPKVSTASIYRTLEALVGKGEADRIDTGTAHASYEMAHGRAHHHHVICTSCGYMEDIDVCPVRKIESFVLESSPRFVGLSRHSMEFFGLCKRCA